MEEYDTKHYKYSKSQSKRINYINICIILTCLEEAELQCVLWPIWLQENCWCFSPWLWMLELCASFLKGGANLFGAELCMHMSPWCAMVAGSMLCLGGCICTEVCLLVLLVCASLWALLSKAFRRFSSIFLCCSAVSWLDMLHSVALPAKAN